MVRKVFSGGEESIMYLIKRLIYVRKRMISNLFKTLSRI